MANSFDSWRPSDGEDDFWGHLNIPSQEEYNNSRTDLEHKVEGVEPIPSSNKDIIYGMIISGGSLLFLGMGIYKFIEYCWSP